MTYAMLWGNGTKSLLYHLGLFLSVLQWQRRYYRRCCLFHSNMPKDRFVREHAPPCAKGTRRAYVFLRDLVSCRPYDSMGCASGYNDAAWKWYRPRCEDGWSGSGPPPIRPLSTRKMTASLTRNGTIPLATAWRSVHQPRSVMHTLELRR
jgi:hypothetical protein